MGYLFFQTKEVSGAFNRKLNDFKASLGSAIGNGENITFADQDITHLLKLQHDRISRKGLEFDCETYSRDEGKNRFTAGSCWQDAHYESTVCFHSCGIKRNVKKDGKKKYSDDRKCVLYETITDVVTGAHPDNDPFCCPNCGAVTTVAGLQDGCPHCGTRFQMDDLFPKVTSYYFFGRSGNDKKGIQNRVSRFLYHDADYHVYFRLYPEKGDRLLYRSGHRKYRYRVFSVCLLSAHEADCRCNRCCGKNGNCRFTKEI